MNTRILRRHLEDLSYAYPIDISDDGRWIKVRCFKTPPGYNRSQIDVRLRLPDDYPVGHPGVSPSRVYVPADLRYQGKVPRDFHKHDSQWAWWCFERVDWDPCRDDLITFFEILRMTMTEAPIGGRKSWVERLLSE